MNRKLIVVGCFLTMTLSGQMVSAGESLINHMRAMQYFTHKLGLSIDAGNQKLAGFYAHEVEEVIEDLEKIGDYKGKSISAQSERLLKPKFENLEKQIKSGDMKATSMAYDQMLESCNSCHVATQHGYIKINRTSTNPYMQSFD